MEKSTQISLVVASAGLFVNQYQKRLINQPGFYEKYEEPKLMSQDQLKMLGGLAAIGGLASAFIFEKFKDNPKARKISFYSLGGLGIAWFAMIIYALKKMS